MTSWRSRTSYPSGTRPPIQMPLRLEAAILSRMRSPVTSGSNCANESKTFFCDCGHLKQGGQRFVESACNRAFVKASLFLCFVPAKHKGLSSTAEKFHCGDVCAMHKLVVVVGEKAQDHSHSTWVTAGLGYPTRMRGDQVVARNPSFALLCLVFLRGCSDRFEILLDETSLHSSRLLLGMPLADGNDLVCEVGDCA